MLQDLTFALRQLSMHRVYALTAILTVALGVGANTAIVSVADSVLFRPLPFVDADRLFALRIADTRTGDLIGSLPRSAVVAAAGTGLFDRMAAISTRPTRAYVRTPAGLDLLSLSPVSADYLEMLGVRPAAGRLFTPSDGGTRAVLLTYRSWMRRYGGSPAVVDSSIASVLRSLDGATANDPPLHVVGILPPRLRLPVLPDGDGVILMDGNPVGGNPWPPLVRLKAGVTSEAAAVRLRAVAVPDVEPGTSELRLVPLREELTFQQGSVLWLLVAAAITVLLVASVNLANLMIARGSARARELSIRAALGASRTRLLRLLFVETACLATMGTAVGLGIAYGGFRVLVTLLPPALAATVNPVFDVRVLVIGVLTATTAAVGFGLVPAIRLSRSDARDGLRLGRLQAHTPRHGRQLLVAVEVGICLALVVGAALVGRSLLALLSEDLGFQPHRLVVTFDLPTLVVVKNGSVLPDLPARAAYFRERLRDVRTVPGVVAAGAVYAPPFSGARPEAPLTEGRGDRMGGIYGVTSGYFRAVGAPLLAGRYLTDAESFAGAPIGVLNATAAREFCGAPAACLGHVVRAPEQPPRTVVGVVGDLRRSVRQKAIATMYVPFDAKTLVLASIVVDMVDTPANRASLEQALSASPDARVNLQSLDDARDQELSPYRFNAIIVGTFAVLTLALAIVGIYGVMAAVVAERTREFGIRIALGATRARVNRHVLTRATVPVCAGIGGGLIVALWGSRSIASLLYGVVPLDAASFSVAAVLVLVCGLTAASVPANRAARVDPIVALRAE